MATFAEYIKMSREQLQKELAESRKSLFDTRYQVQNKQSKASHTITNFKKSIAQILTILNGAADAAASPARGSAKDLETEDKTVQNAPAQKRKAAPKAAKVKKASTK